MLHVQEGTILSQNHPRTSDQYNPLGMSFGSLSQLYCSPRATFDSGDRLEPPRCSETTRIGIIHKMERWIDEERPSNMAPSSIFWLYGGAGVGKSALAQILPENSHQKQKLAASFFFLQERYIKEQWRYFDSNSRLSTGPQLFPRTGSPCRTKDPRKPRPIYQAIPDSSPRAPCRPFAQSKVQKSIVFFSSTQHERLIYKDALGSRPRLIVIDGLDECRRPEIQCGLLRALAAAIPLIP